MSGATTVVETAAGRVRGTRRGRVTSWLGVPYAAPPVGRLRFDAPQPPEPWAGERLADSVAPSAPQNGSLLAVRVRGAPPPAEDCLYLNVHSPAADGAARPVLVWIHGGAFTGGSAAGYDGAQLAADGDIVVVAINYRLGVFGFVDLGTALEADVPANLGLRDQIAALAWVRENIAAFGGDPDRVTVAGESAGSVSVALLLCVPQTAGLFRAAIMQSGSYSLVHGQHQSRRVARGYLDELGVRDLAALRALPVGALLAAQRAVDRATPRSVPAAPWFDGELLPASLAAARACSRPEVALLAGHTRDEIRLFQLLPGDMLPTRRDEIAQRLRAELPPEQAAGILESYPRSRRGSSQLATDFTFAMPTVHLAERHAAAGGATYVYRFDAAVPVLGATHASELPYLWGWKGSAAFALRGLPTPARASLGRRVRRYWTAFVRQGRPGTRWPAYTLAERTTFVLRPRADTPRPDPAGARRAAWAGADVLPHP